MTRTTTAASNQKWAWELCGGVNLDYSLTTTGASMRDLQSAGAIWSKGILFAVLGVVAAGLLLAEAGSPKVLALLVLTVWSFCRAYYFAFYVIEKYVDPSYRFSGLGSFCQYLWRRRAGSAPAQKPRPNE